MRIRGPICFWLISALCCAGANLHGALQSGTYHTAPGTSVEETGDAVPNRSRIVPFAATLTLDLESPQPVLVATIQNAVLEGGSPFSLTVRSSEGMRLADGSYRFGGDYLLDLQPAGSQYIFDWRFFSTPNDTVLWEGSMGWAGGHLWQVTLDEIQLIPEPSTWILLIFAGVVFCCFRVLCFR